MAVHDQPAIEWRGDVPVATRFGDPYYSLHGGADETTHVFLRGNDLPARFRPGFHIAELGFGTGLNFLVALTAFRACGCGGVLRFTSFEAYPMAPADLARALTAWPDLPIEILIDVAGAPRIEGTDFDLTLIVGDARARLPEWPGRADAWFLDGFAPARNPELWGDALMAQVAAHTVPGGTFATYSAAGEVRRSLATAGFAVERVAGYGTKRHMTRGRLSDAHAPG